MNSTSQQQQLQQQQQQQQRHRQQELTHDVDDLDLRIAQTRRELAQLREHNRRQCVDHQQHIHSLQDKYNVMKSKLDKDGNRLNMFLYTHAMLQAQTSVVQPYVLKKQALLCHAFHHNEVMTKQIHLWQYHAEQLVAVLEHSMRQIQAFWQARLRQLEESILTTRLEIAKLQNLPQRIFANDNDNNCRDSEQNSSAAAAAHHDLLVSVASMAMMAMGGFHPTLKFPQRMRGPSSAKTTSSPKSLDVIWEESSSSSPPPQKPLTLNSPVPSVAIKAPLSAQRHNLVIH